MALFWGSLQNYLSSHTGYYLVVVEAKNACGQASKTALLNVISVPPPTSNFTFTIGGSTNVTPSTTYPGNSACQLSTTVNGNSSSGFVTYYSIEIRQVNCSTGADMGSIGTYNSSSVLNNDPANINGITIGTIVEDPIYFLLNPNNCYKIIYTVGNPCGNQASVGYFTNNTYCRIGLIEDEIFSNSTIVSPNPVRERTTLSFKLNETLPVTLKLMDLKGNEYLILDNEVFSAGLYEKELDLTTLPSGIYIYQLLTDKLTTGKIIKSE